MFYIADRRFRQRGCGCDKPRSPGEVAPYVFKFGVALVRNKPKTYFQLPQTRLYPLVSGLSPVAIRDQLSLSTGFKPNLPRLKADCGCSNFVEVWP
ncbi:hypothetical protein GcM3_068030 [Golovinomyces cichoracearum]|uniref:Uncharacterized protein n=1 Tax=Golovinomyces cichoracearum TaxID=62708 RepID=A0A420ITK1_9PEZI|nr:hypothetical protein GcM3_068030 [Golovinomyces cichoracearum]